MAVQVKPEYGGELPGTQARSAVPPRGLMASEGASRPPGTVSGGEWRWCLAVAAVVMALTCIPYLWLWRMAPPRSEERRVGKECRL